MSNTFETRYGGAVQQYGPVDTAKKFPSVEGAENEVRVMTFQFTYDDLPGTDADNNLVIAIPAYSKIHSVSVGAVVPFAGSSGAGFSVGLSTSAGVEIDNDGLVTASDATVVKLDTKGKWVEGTGALVGQGIGPDDGQVVVVPSGTLSAGEAKVVIEYVPLDDHASS